MLAGLCSGGYQRAQLHLVRCVGCDNAIITDVRHLYVDIFPRLVDRVQCLSRKLQVVLCGGRRGSLSLVCPWGPIDAAVVVRDGR